MTHYGLISNVSLYYIVCMQIEQKIAEKLATVLPHLNEKQRRLLIAAEAKTLGWGGISKVVKATGVSRVTIHKALTDWDTGHLVAVACVVPSKVKTTFLSPVTDSR